mgnify:CR=1 FL=1
MTIMVTLLGQSPLFILDYQLEIPFNFMKNGTPTKEFTIIAKAAATDGDVTVTGGGSNIAQIIEGPRIFMAENKFKEIYETPTLYGFLFDVEEQYQQEMETYLAQDTDVAYTSILTMKATVSGVKKCCPADWRNDWRGICPGWSNQLHQPGYDQYHYPTS